MGENLDEIGYLGFSSIGAESKVRSEKGEVFRQGEGFSHPGHRIIGISAVPIKDDDGWNSGEDDQVDFLTVGHILGTTLYSVNCFKVGFILNEGKHVKRPVLVPIGRRTFSLPVVDACWNLNFPEEFVVLLENGDLHWMKPELGCGVKIGALVGENGRWLRCEFGVKPWQVFVVSSMAVTLLDLRSKNASKRSTLARIEDPCAYTEVNSFAKDRFIAFTLARDHDYLFCVTTEHHLFLYDLRQPLVPILRWSHGLDCPRYLAVYPLRDLRPSEKFKWSSNSGFAVVSGSFSRSQFSIFCCGPKECEQEMNGKIMIASLLPTMYAWELPSDLCMLGQKFSSADDLVREEFLKDSEELVLGFAILPSDSLTVPSEYPDPGGFSLLLLSSSGRLELQMHSAYWKTSKHVQDSSRSRDSHLTSDNHNDALQARHDFINLKFLSSYLSGDLCNTVDVEIKKQGTLDPTESEISVELPQAHSLFDHIKDVGVPSSIHEIASRIVLFSLDQNILRLAFSQFSDLFPDQRKSSFDFPEIRDWLSLFLHKPASKNVRGQMKLDPSKDRIVGPVLPLPLLLSLQRIQEEEKKDEDLMETQYRRIIESVFPEISLASSEMTEEENPFLIHEPGSCIQGKVQTCKEDEEHKEISFLAAKDDKFSVFVHGNDKRPEGSEVFDGLASFKLHFDAPAIQISSSEEKIFGSLKRQFSMWQTSGFDHDLCHADKLMRKT